MVLKFWKTTDPIKQNRWIHIKWHSVFCLKYFSLSFWSKPHKICNRGLTMIKLIHRSHTWVNVAQFFATSVFIDIFLSLTPFWKQCLHALFIFKKDLQYNSVLILILIVVEKLLVLVSMGKTSIFYGQFVIF